VAVAGILAHSRAKAAREWGPCAAGEADDGGTDGAGRLFELAVFRLGIDGAADDEARAASTFDIRVRERRQVGPG